MIASWFARNSKNCVHDEVRSCHDKLNSLREAERIGVHAFNARLAGCADIMPRTASFYFWPPRKGMIEKGKGCTLVLITVSGYAKKISTLIKKHHSDTMLCIGVMKMSDVDPGYARWLNGELRKNS